MANKVDWASIVGPVILAGLLIFVVIKSSRDKEKMEQYCTEQCNNRIANYETVAKANSTISQMSMKKIAELTKEKDSLITLKSKITIKKIYYEKIHADTSRAYQLALWDSLRAIYRRNQR